jgi:hypothetical protein
MSIGIAIGPGICRVYNAKVVAVVDNFFLLLTGFTQILPATMLYFNPSNLWLNIYLKAIVWPFIHITQLSTIWITVLIAFNRYHAIRHRFDRDRLHSLDTAKRQVITGSL